MTSPDEPSATLPADPPVPAPVLPPPAAADPTPVAPAPASAEPAMPTVKASRAPRQQVSDETLAAWQATIASDRAQRQRRDRTALVARERAAAFRELRAALRRLQEEPAEREPERDPLRDDDLAVAVHEAPARIRRILAATLTALTAKRRR